MNQTGFAMKHLTLAIALAAFTAGAAAQSAPKAAGHWEGTVQYGNPPLSFALDLSRDASGAWAGSFSVAGSTSGAGIPVSNITATDAGVTFSISVGDVATFDGKFSADGTTLTGSASNSQGSAPFDAKRTGDARVAPPPPPSTALPKEFEGRWEGAVEAAGQRVRIAMKLSTGADGKAAATLISIDQGGQEFAASTVTVDGKKLNVEVRSIAGTYAGTLGDNGELAGDWTQGGVKLALVLKKMP
ncbi:MAG TPA: hypothetical protein VGQ30_10370 [Gemmatimonadaceae bacterium]|jgi:hypothetical protein|nr:hypothetical protein [Gemmatimonadaceae bacterium]